MMNACLFQKQFGLAISVWLGTLVSSPHLLSAQGLYNGSSVSVGASLYVDGDIKNDGVLINNGYIGFTRDWTSPGGYSGSGTLGARGQSPQRIAHFGQRVAALIVDGWGTKYIDGKIYVANELGLQKGIVEVSALDELAVSDKAVVSGGSRDSYVDGALTAEGTGYRFFPVGKNGKYAPLEFLDVKGETSRYSVEVFEDAPVVSIEDVLLRSALYWQRRDLEGTFGGSAISVGYEPLLFSDPKKIALVAGTDWDSPFSIITGVRNSSSEDKLVTRTDITAPIIALGEVSDTWTGADFYLSTALSPNASHPENRVMKIFGERLSPEQFHLTVFNRWGSVVFETRSLDRMTHNGWDGRSIGGSSLATGAYPYKLTALDKSGGSVEKKGVITIVY